MQVLEWTLLNSFVAYVGYILAAYTIDKPWMGRMRLQSLGFLMSFILFICCGLAYHKLIHPSEPTPSASAIQFCKYAEPHGPVFHLKPTTTKINLPPVHHRETLTAWCSMQLLCWRRHH